MSKCKAGIYGKERAAERLGVSARTLQRYSQRLGMQRSKMGSRLRMVFSEQDLCDIQKLRRRSK